MCQSQTRRDKDESDHDEKLFVARTEHFKKNGDMKNCYTCRDARGTVHLSYTRDWRMSRRCPRGITSKKFRDFVNGINVHYSKDQSKFAEKSRCRPKMQASRPQRSSKPAVAKQQNPSPDLPLPELQNDILPYSTEAGRCGCRDTKKQETKRQRDPSLPVGHTKTAIPLPDYPRPDTGRQKRPSNDAAEE